MTVTFGRLTFLFFSQVDDGTAVIDCSHPHPQPVQQFKVNAKRTLSELSEKPEPPPVLKPVAKVGSFVRVVGKVRAVYNSRQIIVDRIGMSMNVTFLAPSDGAFYRQRHAVLQMTSSCIRDLFASCIERCIL